MKMEKETGTDNQGFSMDVSQSENDPGGNFGKDPKASKDFCEDGKEDKPKRTEPLRKFKRTIIIEPSFALFFMFHVSSYPLSSQFLYFAIGEKYNLSALLAAAGDSVNSTGSEGPCGAHVDRNSSLYLLQQQVQAETSDFNLYLDLSTGIPAVIAVMFYGTLTDRLGRKPGLIIPIIGVMIKALTYLLVQVLNLPLELIYFAYTVEALTGGIGAFMTSCYAFYADTVSPDNMGKRLAISDVAYGFTLAVMDVLMGFIIQWTGFVWPFVIVVSGHVINLIYTIFFIPETVDKSKNKKPISPKYIVESFKVLSRKRANNGRFLLLFYLLVWIVCGLATFHRYNLQQLYKLNSPFCWTPSLIGMFTGIQAVLVNTVQVIAAVVLMKRLGELSIVEISLTSFALAYILEAFSYTDWMLWMVPFVGCFMGLQLPVMRAIVSGLVPNEEQGALFSVLSASDRLLGMAFSPFFYSIYSATLLTFKGTVFIVMTAFVVIAMILLGIFGTLQKKQKKEKEFYIDTISVHSLEVFNSRM